MNKQAHIRAKEYHSVLKNNEVLIHAIALMAFENTLSG